MVRFRAPARLIALAVAYALAMQGLLTALSPPAVGGPAPLLVLCSALADGPSGQSPADHRPGTASCGACVLGGCAGGACLPPVPPAVAFGWTASEAASGLQTRSLAVPARRTPQNPRGPPPA